MSYFMRILGGLLTFLSIVIAGLGGAVVAVSYPLSPAYAQSGVVISQISIQGNRRVESQTIINYMQIKRGERYDPYKVDLSFKALFSTGLFEDVSITLQSTTLAVVVVENPIINRVAFEGNRKLPDEALATAIELRARVVLTRAKVQSDLQRILTIYRRTGRFGARVEPKIIKLPQNRVDLVFEIDEGDKTGVTRINFIGNRAFSDSDLRDIITTDETGFFSFLNSNDIYDPDRLSADQELLRRHYLRSGYADFRVISAVADLDNERNAFFITITVDEGPRYSFGAVQIESNVRSIDPGLLRNVVHTYEGEVYNLELIDRTLEDLTLEVSKLGYAFAQVRPRGDRDPLTNTVSLTFVIDEGPRVYIERIDIRGNTRTQDDVVRREFQLAEGDAYNRVLIERAERRLNALGFFAKVTITREPGSASDRVIIVVQVEEQPTGQISVGAGFSTTDGIIGDISISERNLLGRGQFVRLALNVSSSRTDLDFSFTEPYFMNRRVSAGIDLFSRDVELGDSSSYQSLKRGGGVRFGFPLTPDLSLTTRLQVSSEEVEIDAGTFVSPAVRADSGSKVVSLVGYSLRFDTVNNKQDPTNGLFVLLSQDFAGVGGDVKYVRTTAEARLYQKFFDKFVGILRVEGGNITGFGGDDVRVSDGFFKGGETIRGFDRAGIGPRDGTPGGTLDALGGKNYVAASAEVQFPLFLVPDELGFKGAVFADAGTVFGSDAKGKLFDLDPGPGVVLGTIPVLDSSALRSAVGVSILWKSPFGPVRADFSHILSSETYDEEQVFRFGGGTQF